MTDLSDDTKSAVDRFGQLSAAMEEARALHRSLTGDLPIGRPTPTAFTASEFAQSMSVTWDEARCILRTLIKTRRYRVVKALAPDLRGNVCAQNFYLPVEVPVAVQSNKEAVKPTVRKRTKP